MPKYKINFNTDYNIIIDPCATRSSLTSICFLQSWQWQYSLTMVPHTFNEQDSLQLCMTSQEREHRGTATATAGMASQEREHRGTATTTAGMASQERELTEEQLLLQLVWLHRRGS